MGKLIIRLTLGLFATALWAGYATAQDAPTPQYLVEYQRYNDALGRGDSDAATEHARAAWQSAEETLGDDRLTAVLAFNYGFQALFSDPGGAKEALSRSATLTEAGIGAGDVPNNELNIFLLFAELKANGYKRSVTDELRNALTEYDVGGLHSYPEIAIIALELASLEFIERRYDDSAVAADLAIAFLPQAYSNPIGLLAQSYMLAGAARTNDTNLVYTSKRARNKIERAHEDFIGALALFEPQIDIDSFDKNYSLAIAWDAAIHAILLSLDRNASDSERNELRAQHPDIPALARDKVARDECGNEWEKRKPPKYPNKPLRKGYVGAVLAGYHIGADGKIEAPRILAEVPAEQFSEAVLKSMNSWTLKSPPPDTDICRKNFLSVVTFMISG